jgi:signal transduction histidine kinase
MENDSSKEEVYKRMLERERSARKQAEQFLEERSLELYLSNRDLTEALAKQKQEAFYHQVILDTVKDGILTIGADGVVQTANPSAVSIFGLELVGLKVDQLISAAETVEPPKLLNRFLADYCNYNQPLISVSGNGVEGKILDLELSASFGEIEGQILITWVIRDVGYLNSIKQKSNLSQRLEGIGELAAGVAHEVNTPIQFVIENTKFFGEAYSAISRVLDVYEQHAINNEPLRESIERVCPFDQLRFYRSEIETAIDDTISGATRVGDIVAAIKEFAHPGNEERTLVSLNDLLATAITVTTNNHKYVAEIERKFDPQLPSVSCLRGQITQVLVNLLVNAADAIAELWPQREGGKIIIKTWHNDDHVFFSVQDTGVGIKNENLEKIFLPFFTTKPVGKGTGQGLAISHTIIVENHRGTLDIASELGQGTTVAVRLPRSL